MLMGKVSVISLPVRSCSFEDNSFTLILELKSILDHPRYCPASICANSREKSFEGREDSFFSVTHFPSFWHRRCWLVRSLKLLGTRGISVRAERVISENLTL